MHLRRRMCWALLSALLLAGCRMDAAVDVVVDTDGGGTLAVTLAADEQLRAAAAKAGADPLAALARAGRELEGWQVTESAGGSVTLATRFRDAVELERVSTELAAGLDAPEVRALGPLRLTVTDDTITLSGTAGLRTSGAVEELGLTQARAEARLAEALRFRVTARMPGAVVRTNADAQPDSRTVVWTIAPGTHRALRVTSERPWTLARLAAFLTASQRLTAILVGAMLALAARRQQRDDLFSWAEARPRLRRAFRGTGTHETTVSAAVSVGRPRRRRRRARL